MENSHLVIASAIIAVTMVMLAFPSANAAPSMQISDANPDTVVIVQSKFQKHSQQANKNYGKQMMMIQSEYNLAKLNAKLIYQDSIAKAGSNSAKLADARITYHSMIADAKNVYLNQVKDAKMNYHSELLQIKDIYSKPIEAWTRS